MMMFDFYFRRIRVYDQFFLHQRYKLSQEAGKRAKPVQQVLKQGSNFQELYYIDPNSDPTQDPTTLLFDRKERKRGQATGIRRVSVWLFPLFLASCSLVVASFLPASSCSHLVASFAQGQAHQGFALGFAPLLHLVALYHTSSSARGPFVEAPSSFGSVHELGQIPSFCPPCVEPFQFLSFLLLLYSSQNFSRSAKKGSQQEALSS